MAKNRHSGMIEIREGKLSDSERIVELQLQMARETEGLELDKTVVSRECAAFFRNRHEEPIGLRRKKTRS